MDEALEDGTFLLSEDDLESYLDEETLSLRDSVEMMREMAEMHAQIHEHLAANVLIDRRAEAAYRIMARDYACMLDRAMTNSFNARATTPSFSKTRH